MSDFAQEIKHGKRFRFGKNWKSFLSNLNDRCLEEAKDSIRMITRCDTLEGKRFLDIGSGSGLFSLAARNLGAWVYSFDYDPDSVACTRELRNRYYPNDPNWIVEEKSVLDKDFLQSMIPFDIVYSWGVLHHTGDMWQALGNVANLVNDRGILIISIYNDQGGGSRRWKTIKRFYSSHPNTVGWFLLIAVLIYFEFRTAFVRLISMKNPFSFSHWKKSQRRGMSYWHNIIDWVGGYPFEVAKPEDVFNFFKKKGFTLQYLKTCGGGIGCNEYMFERKS